MKNITLAPHLLQAQQALGTILQEIKFFKSRKCFSIVTSPVMVSNVIRVELHSLILENRCEIHEI